MENKFKLQGKVISKSDVQVINEKFSKQTFVIEFDESNNDYKQTHNVSFDAISKKMFTALEPIQLGDEIVVQFSVTGRAWNDKFFNTLKAWGVETVGKATQVDDSQHAAPIVGDLPWEV